MQNFWLDPSVLNAVQQYSTSATQIPSATFNINSLNNFPVLPCDAQQIPSHSSYNLIDALVNMISSKMEKINEATTNRIVKSPQGRASKLENTVATVDNMMDIEPTESLTDSSFDSDNDMPATNNKQSKQQCPTSPSITCTQQHATANSVTSEPSNKKKATSKTANRNRSPSSL